MDKQKGFVEFVGLRYEPMPLNHHLQPNMEAYKLPNRDGVGNDMDQIPNAVNNSRYEYCTNAHGESVFKSRPR